MAVHPSPLPWGEGEPSLRGEQSTALGLPPARCALFPLPELPEGEGQGEGKRRGLPSRVSDRSRRCRTGRVLRQSRRFSLDYCEKLRRNRPIETKRKILCLRIGELDQGIII